MPFIIGPAVAAVGTAVGVGVAATATAVAGAIGAVATVAGIAMTVVGAATGDKGLMKIGGIVGIAGGVTGLATSARFKNSPNRDQILAFMKRDGNDEQ